MSRPLNDVATTSDSVLMSRPLLDVATSSRCRDFEVQSLETLMSRLLLGVTTSMSTSLFNLWLPDLEFLCDQLVLPSIALMSRLEFCGCDLDMSLHYYQGVATSSPLILVNLSCCDLIQPVVSVLLSHFLLLLL